MSRARDIEMQPEQVTSAGSLPVVRPGGWNATAITRASVRCKLECETCGVRTPVELQVAAGGQEYASSVEMQNTSRAMLENIAEQRAAAGLLTELEATLAWVRCPACGERGELSKFNRRTWITLAVGVAMSPLLPLSFLSETPILAPFGLVGVTLVILIAVFPLAMRIRVLRNVRVLTGR